jgi:hypothetical protein
MKSCNPCTDKKCLDRKHNGKIADTLRLYGGQCTNPGCEESEFKNLYQLSDLVGQVVITDTCSSETVKKIDSLKLHPEIFKIGNQWTKNN